MSFRVVITCAFLVVAGCATDYQKNGLTGGFAEKQLDGNIWRVGFSGNGYTNYETVQTYWLYHCAELALANGHSGFEILSNIQLTLSLPVDALRAPGEPMQPAAFVYVPISVPNSPKPSIIADIRFLDGDVVDNVPKRFNAAHLKDKLDPIVHAKNKCDMGNVCPHVHDYVYGQQPSGS